ncbi:MAG: tRNA (adenine-N1)-methyltransferase [Candidatus Woesearchaeota archaeon]
MSNTKRVIYKFPHTFKDDKGKIRGDLFEKHIINTDKEFHFSAGILKLEDFEREGLIELNKHKISIFNATFNDEYSKLKRGAQTISKKDIGPIITRTGINRNSTIIDAGAGSGGLTCYLASIAKRVDTFDVNEKNLEVTEKNVKRLKLDNVKLELKNIYEDTLFLEEEYDVFTLDVPEPWQALQTASKTLKLGGYLAVYTPNIMQARETILNMPKSLFHEESLEIIEREWTINDRVSRPITKDFSHTAFLIFFRKIGKHTKK